MKKTIGIIARLPASSNSGSKRRFWRPRAKLYSPRKSAVRAKKLVVIK